ncbi:MAG TPA: MFS transporter [Acidimicrobiales bacterium]|nr:MFS transporter [Acidimicrobiales bacterium]
MAAPSASALAGAILDEEARRHSEQDQRGEVLTPEGLMTLPGVGGPGIAVRELLGNRGAALVVVLASLVLVDNVSSAAFYVLGPDMQRSLHLTDLQLGVIGALGGLVVFVASVPIGYLGDRVNRTRLLAVCSALMALFVLLTGMVRAAWQLVIAWALAGVAKANEQPVHSALLADGYPIEGRNRVYGIHRSGMPLGQVIGPALAGGVAAVAGGGGGWRWVFVAAAIPAAVLAGAALRLPDPARGNREIQSVLGVDALPVGAEGRVSFSAGFARLKKVRTFYFLLSALGALGLAVVAAPIYSNLVLQHTFHQNAAGRGAIGSVVAIGGVIGAIVGGTVGDRVFRRSPEGSLVMTGVLVGAYGVLTPLALYMPNVELYSVVTLLSQVAVFAAFIPTAGVVAAVTPYHLRSLGFATVGLYLSLFGGLGGAVLVGSLADSLGDRGALAAVVPPAGLIGGALIAYGARYVRRDMGLMVADLKEEQDERARTASGGRVPLLQVRHLDASYGSIQVLFDVNVDVWPGEVLALLGTNGAGKSTLLRTVSGLHLPDRGVIRLEGRSMTYAEPGARVRMGVAQMPGGRAVFPNLSVLDNLLAGAYTFIWDRRETSRRIERVMALFPVLAERADQPAGTLSGGEQQMLGLATTLLLEPRLLLIDELSLGLAPVVVQELLASVEAIRAEGVTVVIVEQSLNVALSIADRAVFMEKGQVRFEGAARDLAERDDLVRAVFLGGEGG